MDRGFTQPNRKPSTPWERLKPIKQDPLESMGFVSKGDNRLLDLKMQETFYHKIVSRYMAFCSYHSKDLDNAFASLSLQDQSQSTSNNQSVLGTKLTAAEMERMMPQSAEQTYLLSATTATASVASSATEMSTILTALRKLREGLLATQSRAPSPIFSQRVHVFNIRLAILALHPESYHPALLHLLSVLHTSMHPLPQSEICEMTTYLILDTALRQKDLNRAYTMRFNSRIAFGFESRNLDIIFRAVVTNNWIAFWRVRRRVDGYVRAILHWHVDQTRKSVLKAIGRTYLSCDIQWILQGATGDELTWEKLLQVEDIGWQRDGDKAIIRKPKPRPNEKAVP